MVSKGNEYSYEVRAMNRKNGSVIWRRIARVEAPHDGRHDDGSWASCSPVTDGEHLIASFGSRGLYCYDMDGNLQWEKDFGDLHIRYSWGEGSSPALFGDKLIVTWDHTGNSFIAVLDKSTGRELWRKNRNDGTSWTTPLVVEHNGRRQIVAPSIGRTRCYDLETGKELWTTRGMTANPIPTPVSANGIVYLMGGYGESVLQAISLDKAHGNVSSTGAIVWEHAWDTPYVPSPLLYGGNLYFLKSNQNMLSCFNAATGESYYSRQRLNNVQGVYASPVAAKDRVYVVGRNGVCVVIRHGPRLEILATNRLDDSFSASPVIVGKDLYLRGHKYLYCISSE
jgi:outer membrane protein assembly factor BamB